MLEPVLNLARLQIRADHGTAALQLLEAMHQAITQRCDLTVDDQILPTANLVGEPHDRRQLREWVWLQLIGEGVRALALANRWKDAAEHARRHNGIGVHLIEGRQATISPTAYKATSPRGERYSPGAPQPNRGSRRSRRACICARSRPTR